MPHIFWRVGGSGFSGIATGRLARHFSPSSRVFLHSWERHTILVTLYYRTLVNGQWTIISEEHRRSCSIPSIGLPMMRSRAALFSIRGFSSWMPPEIDRPRR